MSDRTKKPQIAVSSALFRDDRVLLIERSAGQSLAGLLSLPGGRVAFGETLQQAAAREVREEVGLDVEPSSLTFLTNHEAIYEDFHFVICVFAARLETTQDPVAGSDAAAVRFYDHVRLPALEAAGLTTPSLAGIVQSAHPRLKT